MTAVPFDTLKFANKLQSGGFTPEQAKTATEAFSEATSEQLATKADLKEETAPIKAELLLLKWMAGFNLAATMAVLFLLLR
jgi:hypothetical protein